MSGEVTFTCEALGFPPAQVGWSKNGTSLSNSSQNTVHSVTEDNGITLLTRSTLTIRDLRLADSGDYACSASNGRTSDTSSFHLSVNGEIYVYILLYSEVEGYLQLTII